MLAIERRDNILSIIQKNKSVLVSDLSKKYGVTEETIRRDLEKLENDGFVKKTYGGAIYTKTENIDLSMKSKESYINNEKIEIAEKIVSLIEDGDTIMLDSSSISLEVAKLLKTKQRIAVITNSIGALIELSGIRNIDVISTGGILKNNSLSLVGKNAESVINNYNVDKAIISCGGIDIIKGITDYDEQEVEIKKAMCNSANKTIMAVDKLKFDRVVFTKLMKFDDVDIIVTNKIDDIKWIEFFNRINKKVVF